MFRNETMRLSVAAIVLTTFLNMTLSPGKAAAQPPANLSKAERPSWSALTPDGSMVPERVAAHEDDGKLSRALTSLSERLEKLKQRPSGRERHLQEASDLDGVSRELFALNDDALAGFARIEKHLVEKKLPLALLLRHSIAVKQHITRMEALRSLLDGIPQSRNPAEREARIDKARQLLVEGQKKPTRVDPKRLPFRSSDTRARKPYGTPKELHARLFSRLTTAKATAAAALTPPTPQDLSDTEDVQFTQDVQELADTLHHSPVEIFNWVYNNIAFIPTYGSVQGSQLTLDSRRGNAFDIASLLIALLRNSNVPARYVYGTVQIPVDKVMNWTGCTTPTAAQETLSLGGIPNMAMIEGGRVAYINLEHVWVEAYVDFVPSRGAINRTGDTWVPMDAAFKQHQLTAGMNLKENVPFDGQAFADHLESTAQINEQDGSVTSIDTSYVRSSLSTHRDQMRTYIESTRPDATVGDVIGSRPIMPETSSMLTSSLPYRLVATGSRFSSIPETLRHKVTLRLYVSELDRALDHPDVSYSLSLPALHSRRLAVTYAPSTPADAQLIESYVAQGAQSLPAYLIQLRPLIQVDGTTVAMGSSGTMGQPHYWDLTLIEPQGSSAGADSYITTAGDEIVIGINGNGVSPAVVQKRRDTVDHSTASENLHQAALHYWMEYDLLDDLAARNHGVYKQRLPSAGFFSAPLTVNYWFGLPRSASYRGRQMDVKRALLGVSAPSQTTKRSFMTQSGMQGSYLEGSVFDQLFHHAPGKGVSAAQLMLDANQSGIPIYVLTQENLARVLPQLTVSNAVKNDIVSAVTAGKRAVVPKTELAKGSWSGAGYIIQDPETGAAAYLIDGGLNGGFSFNCRGSAVPVASIIVLAILARIIASMGAQAAAAVSIGFVETTAGTLLFTAAGPILAVVSYVLAFVVVAVLISLLLLYLFETLSVSGLAYVDECDCQANLNACLLTRLADVMDGFQSRCVSCYDRCRGPQSWPSSIEVGTCAYWNY